MPPMVYRNGKPHERNGHAGHGRLTLEAHLGSEAYAELTSQLRADCLVERDPEPATPADRRDSRDRRVLGKRDGLAEALVAYLSAYAYMPWPVAVTVAAWVMATWHMDVWDRFGHLGIWSVQPRSGKTRLLELLLQVCRKAELTVNITSAALFRTISIDRPTLLHDEAQFLTRGGSEAAQALNDLFCGSIGKDATTTRCTGPDHTPTKFPIYCPKAIALIGGLKGPLADRSLPILMKRKTKDEKVKRARMRTIEAEGKALQERLERWAAESQADVRERYDGLDPYDIDNDRLAELLLPLQAVLAVAAPALLDGLKQYAEALNRQEQEAEDADPGLRLLCACRTILGKDVSFIASTELVNRLNARTGEGWDEINDGRPLTREKLASMLAAYDVRPSRNKDQTARGYHRRPFEEAWDRYLTARLPGNLPNPSNPSPDPARPAGYDAMVRTPRWFNYSRKVRAHWGNRCAVCYDDGPLEVHHRTYERFGHEELTDCVPLCRNRCHPFADQARRATKGTA